jgi:hypothetical protein
MELLEDIINGAVTNTEPLSNLLRRCLVLAHRLKNRRLGEWANKELNGYSQTDNLPEYRQMPALSKGLFLGGGGAQINNQPLPLHVMEPEHRAIVETLKLCQPISAYEAAPKIDSAQLPWPPILTTRYQGAFIRGYALNRAWQEIPASVLAGLVDTVRNRVLSLALELQDELGAVDNKLEKLPAEVVERSIVNNIYGGTVFIAGSEQNITQIGNIHVGPHDIIELTNALKVLGLNASDISKLQSAIEEDKPNHGETSIGDNVRSWLKQIGKTIGKKGLKVGIEVAEQTATKWIMQYYGLGV